MSSVDASIVRPLELAIHRSEVLHFLEYPEGHQPPERIERLLAEQLPIARSLIEARGCYVHLAVDQAPEIGLAPVDADGLVIGLVTVGAGIETRSSELAAAGEVTRALILDAAGSAAAEEGADRLGALIASESPSPDRPGDPLVDDGADSPRVAALPCRLSPGYGRWKLTSQRALLALLPSEQVGITLMPSCLMVPRKSISFAMWLGARGRIAKGLAGCSRCTLSHCRYRRAVPPSSQNPQSPSEAHP